jgi:hypothetical protein
MLTYKRTHLSTIALRKNNSSFNATSKKHKIQTSRPDRVHEPEASGTNPVSCRSFSVHHERNSMKQSPFWEATRNYPLFMEFKCPSPSSQHPDAGPIFTAEKQSALTPTSFRSILLWSSYPEIRFWNSLIPSGFLIKCTQNLPKTFCHFFPAYYVPCPIHTSSTDDPQNIWPTVQIMKLLTVQFPSAPCYFTSFRSKQFIWARYQASHPWRKNSFAHFNVCIFKQETVRQTIPNWTLPSIPRI